VGLGKVFHGDLLGLGFVVRGQELRLVDEASEQLLLTQLEVEVARHGAEALVQALAEEVARLRA
jgi:hypothetical protein